MLTLRNHHNSLHSLYPYQQCKYSFPYSLLSIVALMTGAPWVLCVTLICISLQDKAVEQFKKFIVHFNFFRTRLFNFLPIYSKDDVLLFIFWSCLQIPDNNSLSDIVVKFFPLPCTLCLPSASSLPGGNFNFVQSVHQFFGLLLCLWSAFHTAHACVNILMCFVSEFC